MEGGRRSGVVDEMAAAGSICKSLPLLTLMRGRVVVEEERVRREGCVFGLRRVGLRYDKWSEMVVMGWIYEWSSGTTDGGREEGEREGLFRKR